MSAAQSKATEAVQPEKGGKSSEPSMEEILASIRRIIADDQPNDVVAAEPAPAHEAPAAEDAEDEVLDLVTVVTHTMPADVGADDLDFLPEGGHGTDDIEARIPMEAMEEPALLRPEPPPLPEPNFDIPDTPMPPPISVAAAPAEPPPQPEMRQPAPEPEIQPLLSPAADTAIAGAFSNLSHTILSQNARTLDDLVREMLRPMLKTWLDDNLPGLVERLVRAEIERVARGGR